jgi:hypothetical protein
VKARSFQPGPVRPSVSSGWRRDLRGDDEDVVGEGGAVVEQELVPLDPDRVDLTLVEDDPVSQLPHPWADDLVQRGEPERDEEQPRLVDVAVVEVDDVDLGFVGVETPAQPVGDHRAAGAAAEDDDPRHGPRVRPDRRAAIGACPEPGTENYEWCSAAIASAFVRWTVPSACSGGE